jgi:hypothetical protein
MPGESWNRILGKPLGQIQMFHKGPGMDPSATSEEGLSVDWSLELGRSGSGSETFSEASKPSAQSLELIQRKVQAIQNIRKHENNAKTNNCEEPGKKCLGLFASRHRQNGTITSDRFLISESITSSIAQRFFVLPSLRGTQKSAKFRSISEIWSDPRDRRFRFVLEFEWLSSCFFRHHDRAMHDLDSRFVFISFHATGAL